MSAEATSWAWSVADRLDNPGQLCVLMALAEHASPEGLCYPKRKTIAFMCAYAHSNTVTKHINRLVDLGLLESNPRFEAKGKLDPVRQTSNEYRLCLEVEGRKMPRAVQPPSSSAVDPPSTDQSGTPQLPGVGKEPSVEPVVKPTDSQEAKAKKVYEHWRNLFHPKRPPLFGAAVLRQIGKGLAIYSEDDLCAAYDGLFEWRKTKPGKVNLGAVLDTYPGGKPLHEQIAFFISQAKDSTGVDGKFPSAPRARIAEHQRWVQRGHRLKDNAEAVKKGKESQVWLFEHGIVTIPAGPGEDRPNFRQRRDDDRPPLFAADTGDRTQ